MHLLFIIAKLAFRELNEEYQQHTNKSNSVSNNEIGPKFTILNSDDNDEIDNDNDHMCKVTDCDN